MLVQNFIRSGEISVFRAKIAYFRSLPLGVCVPTSSPNRAAFERITCLFGAQLVPFSSPDRTSFEPKKIFFRAQIVPISCPNRASFEPCSCCYRALFELLSSPFMLCPFEHWLCNMLRGKTWRYFSAGQFQQA